MRKPRAFPASRLRFTLQAASKSSVRFRMDARKHFCSRVGHVLLSDDFGVSWRVGAARGFGAADKCSNENQAVPPWLAVSLDAPPFPFFVMSQGRRGYTTLSPPSWLRLRPVRAPSRAQKCFFASIGENFFGPSADGCKDSSTVVRSPSCCLSKLRKRVLSGRTGVVVKYPSVPMLPLPGCFLPFYSETWRCLRARIENNSQPLPAFNFNNAFCCVLCSQLS